MSTQDNRNAERLRHALRDRSEDMAGSSVGLDDVRGRAGAIRRRRRVAAGAAAAVVLAVAVPVGLDVAGVTRGSEPLPAGPSPTQSQDPDEQQAPSGPVTLDVAAAPRGEDPAITYLAGRTLHSPDGSELGLPQRYSSVAPYGDGWVGISVADGTTTFLDADGRPTQAPYPGSSAAVSTDGESLATVLYAAADNVDLQLWPTAGADPDEGYQSHVVAFSGDLEYAGFTAPGTVAYNLTVSGQHGATVTPYVASWFSDEEPRELTGLEYVDAANDATGVVSGMTEVDQVAGRYCSAVVDATTGRPVWETCELRLRAFSPDGRYVLGTDPQVDGPGGRSLTILNARTGDVVAEFEVRDRAYLQDAVWESGSTVLVPGYQGDAWYLLRLRPDGTVERALDTARTGVDETSPWTFEVMP